MEIRGHVSERNRRTRNFKESADRAHLLVDITSVNSAGPILRRILDHQGITNQSLAAFRLNVMRAKRQFGAAYEEGITAQEAIDISQRTPLKYKRKQKGNYINDLEKAKHEIRKCIPASMVRDECRFITNAGFKSKQRQHYVTIKFSGFKEAIGQVLSGAKTPKQAAQMMRKSKLKMHCTCERWQFFFSYLATIGGYNCGPAQRGYPKIRNPDLDGCCCKHALRALAEVNSSNFMLGFFERAIKNTAGYNKATKVTKEELSQKVRNQDIKTTAQRIFARNQAKKAAAIKAARDRDIQKARERKADRTKSLPVEDISPHAKRMRSLNPMEAAKQLAKMFGMKANQIFEAISQWKARK